MHVKRSLSSIRKWGWQAGSSQPAHCAFAQGEGDGDGKSLTLVCPHAQPVARLGKVFWTLAQPGENYMVGIISEKIPKKKTKTSAKRCMQIAKNYSWLMGRIRLVNSPITNWGIRAVTQREWHRMQQVCNDGTQHGHLCGGTTLTWFLKLQWSQLLVKCSARN